MTVFGEELGTTTQVGEMETVIEYVTNKIFLWNLWNSSARDKKEWGGRRGGEVGGEEKLAYLLSCLPSVLYFPRKSFHMTC